MSGPVAVRRAGDRGLLLELGGNEGVHALAIAARATWGELLEEVVPGHSTLLLLWRGEPPADAERILEELIAVPEGEPSAAGELTIPVRYDGPDLEAVASAAGMALEEVVSLHGERTYTAAFIGFAPGFAYLIGGDERLAIPRRETPRVRVEAGSVAIAAGYCAVYPTAGPGGWHIIGRTEVALFDPGRERPSLIEPGTRVRFQAERG